MRAPLSPPSSRSITSPGPCPVGAITLKRYVLTVGTPLEPRLLSAATGRAVRALARPRQPRVIAGVDWAQAPAHDVAVLTVHQARHAVFVLLHWWIDENVLCQRVWVAPAATPTAFRSLAATDAVMCVHELVIIAHERAAWQRHILDALVPDRIAYLQDTLPRLADSP